MQAEKCAYWLVTLHLLKLGIQTKGLDMCYYAQHFAEWSLQTIIGVKLIVKVPFTWYYFVL